MSPRLLLASLVLAFAAGSAGAEEVRLYRQSEAVDPQDVARILDTSAASAPVVKMRSIRLLDDAAPGASQAVAAAAAAVATAEVAKRAQPAALALPVQFAFDSADILPAARAQLDALAEGVRLLPAAQTVIIEGHTDAVGSDQYNELLSQRRAQSVKRYLVDVRGIDPARLKAVGMGKHAPLPGRAPHAPENRRVQFRGE